MDPDLFLRKVTHDLRAPLRALKELPLWVEEEFEIADAVPPGEVSTHLAMMRKQASRMDDIVVGLFEYVRVSAEEGGSVDLSAIIEAIRKDTSDEVELSRTHLPMAPAHAERVLHHLIDNALKHGDGANGGIRLIVASMEKEVRLAVIDRGPGVRESFLASAYEPLSTA